MASHRLLAALLLLQQRGRVTAAEVADELGVSLATARRDLQALSTAGVPVYPTRGRAGGWQLVGGARTDLTGLTAGEAEALFLLLGPAVGSSPDAVQAVRKLLRALPATFREAAAAAADAVVVDPVGWGATGRDRPPLADLLQDAVVRRRQVRLGYDGRSTGRHDGPVHPWGLVAKDGVWYLLGGVGDGPDPVHRTFRLDRVRGAEVLGASATRPADLDLAQEWAEVVERVEEARAGVVATVLLDARLAPVLRSQLGRGCSEPRPTADGRVVVQVSAPAPVMVAQHLAGWGAMVEVTGPPEVRAELARIGAELVARYG